MSGADGIVKIPELRKRITFALIMLAVYRIGVHIPTPGVNGDALQQVFANMKGTIFGWFNLFSGGALERFSIFALGVMPYISSSIIFQLLTVVVPQLHELQKEGDQEIYTFIIDPDASNLKAKHVYEKGGFRVVGDFYRDFGSEKNVKHLLMVKHLSN